MIPEDAASVGKYMYRIKSIVGGYRYFFVMKVLPQCFCLFVLRMLRGSNSNQHRNLPIKLHRIRWFLFPTLHLYFKTVLYTALFTSLYRYRYIEIHIPFSICFLSLQTEIGNPSICFACIYPRKQRFLLRMC